jgi:hypothetical protein
MSSTAKAYLRIARKCVHEAQRADQRGQRHYASNLRASARAALGELDATTALWSRSGRRMRDEES